MSTPRRSGRFPGSPLRAAVVGGLAALLLSGCAGTSPGVAVRVGDEEITSNELDELVSEYCTALERQLAANQATVLNRTFRRGMAGTMALRSMAEQIADQYDVGPGQTYDDKVATLQQSVSVLPEDVREVVVDVETQGTYVEGVKAAVGQQLLLEEKGSAGAYSDQLARGSAEFAEWQAEHEIVFDPALGVDIVDGKITPVDTSISYPVGENAKAGAAEQPDAAYSRAQPATQRCN